MTRTRIMILIAVLAAATVLASPAAIRHRAGDDVCLRAPVPAGMACQWRRNGRDLPGATSPTLLLTAATAADSGAYTCIAAGAVRHIVELAVRADTIIYVDADATGNNNGSSWADAYPDLFDALEAAVAGDEIWVAEGTYKPDLIFYSRGTAFALKSGVAVYGGFAGNEDRRDQRDWQRRPTILSGDLDGDDTDSVDPDDFSRQDNSYNVVLADNVDSTGILDGFTIRDGNANGDFYTDEDGGGMRIVGGGPTVANCTFLRNSAIKDGGGMTNRSGASTTVSNCVFLNNWAEDDGGGMANWSDADATISDCTFADNFARGVGGGMANQANSAPVINRCTFTANEAWSNGGAMVNDFSSSPTVRNGVFFRNRAGLDGGGMDVNSDPTIINCTFAYNEAARYGGGLNSRNAAVTVTNSIFWGNTPDQIRNPAAVTHSCIEGGYTGTGNIAASPLFRRVDTDNFRIIAGSPCINAGTATGAPADDRDGAARVGVPDMGAFEYLGEGFAPGIAAQPQDAAPAAGQSASFSVTAIGSAPFAYQWQKDGADIPGAVARIHTVANAAAADQGLYRCRVLNRYGSALSQNARLDLQSPTVIHVAADATGANNGSSWANAYTSLQIALAAANDGDEVWVAAGVYKPAGADGDRSLSFSMPDGVGIFGGFAGTETRRDQRDIAANETILSGDLNGDDNDSILPDEPSRQDNSYHVVVNPGNYEDSILDGFTIRDGNANWDVLDDIWQRAWGGGLYLRNSISRVRHCTFTRNTALKYGGGMLITGQGPEISHCTFVRNTAAADGGGMHNYNATTTVLDCDFTDNRAGGVGGGLTCTGGSVDSCTFTDNRAATRGGGAYVDRDVTANLNACRFTGNTLTDVPALADTFGGGLYSAPGSTVAAVNCAFAANTATHGAGLYADSNTVRLVNCSFGANSAATTGGGLYTNGAGATAKNCVFWGNGSEIVNADGGSTTASYSDVQGGYPGSGNIAADPRFENAAGGDLRLGLGSPCIDAGVRDADSPESDLAGNGRDAEPDMGAYEYQGPFSGPRISDHPDDVYALLGEAASFTVVATGTAPLAYQWQQDGADIPGATAATYTIASVTTADFAAYRCRVSDPYGSVTSNSAMLTRLGPVIYVKADAVGDNNGTSWADAYTDLQDALAVARDEVEIWVAAGTYTPGNARADTFALKDGVALYGGFDGTETERDQRHPAVNASILSGDLNGDDNDNIHRDEATRQDNAYHVVTGAYVGDTAVVDGFTITGANANGSNPDFRGGGVYNYHASPTINDCTFIANTATYGAAMGNYVRSTGVVSNCTFTNNDAYQGAGVRNYWNSHVTVENCTFTGNTATYGAGMHVQASTDGVITNCDFIDNTGTYGVGVFFYAWCNPTVTQTRFTGNSGYYGGAVINWVNCNPTFINCLMADNRGTRYGGAIRNVMSTPNLMNCTLANNYARDGGGAIWNLDSTTTVKNSIIWGNGTTIQAGDAAVTYTCIERGWSGAGNISSDPQFVNGAANGDYHLSAGSPCIDAASAYQAPATDLDGNPRGSRPDMGCYEYVGIGSTASQPVTLTLAAATGDDLLADVPVTVNGDTVATPAQLTLTAGSEVVLAAPASIVVDGRTLMLVGWQLDGAAVNNAAPTITVATDITATAIYE